MFPKTIFILLLLFLCNTCCFEISRDLIYKKIAHFERKQLLNIGIKNHQEFLAGSVIRGTGIVEFEDGLRT